MRQILKRLKYRTKDLYYYIRSIPKRIKRLIYWAPVAWEDCEWDHSYMYKVLLHKLKRMEETFSDPDYPLRFKGQDREVRYMHICILLLKRITESDGFSYDDVTYPRYREKWGKMDWRFEPDEEMPGYSKLIIEYENVETEQDDEIRVEEHRRLIKHEQMLEDQDKEYLFKLLRKHSDKWWI